MHVFLTGKVQVGKSTALKKAVELLGVTPGGYCTAFAADRGTRHHYLYMNPAGECPQYDADHAVVEFTRGETVTRTVLPRFEQLGLALLQGAEQSPLIVLDECGRLEEAVPRFRARVLQLLDGDVPIIGVLRFDAAGWLESIRSHPKVHIITVTEENRDAVPAEAAALLRPYLSEASL